MIIPFLVIAFSLIFWPLSLFLANPNSSFWGYDLPALLLIISFYLYKSKSKFYLLPTLIIPLIEPKLVLFPLVMALLNFWHSPKDKLTIPTSVLAVLMLIFFWRPFWGQTIFISDYEARQFVIRKTQLYPSVFTARLFQNKGRIYFDKFSNNLFALIDPNNYFFGFHPREIILNNQNLNKYPYLALPLLFFGLFYLGKNPHKRFIADTLVAGIFSLSVLASFDRHDFILWVPMSLVLISGAFLFRKQYRVIFNLVSLAFAITAIPQLVRILLGY